MSRRTERRARLETSQRFRTSLPGIEPASVREILQHEADQSLRGGRADLQNAGLFGDGRKQREMF